MHPPTASALRSLFRAARSLPSPVRAKLVANVRDVAELGLGTKPTDAAALARLVHWVEGLPKVRGREKKEGGRKSPSAHASLSHAVHAQGLTLAMGRPGRASRAAAREREREREGGEARPPSRRRAPFVASSAAVPPACAATPCPALPSGWSMWMFSVTWAGAGEKERTRVGAPSFCFARARVSLHRRARGRLPDLPPSRLGSIPSAPTHALTLLVSLLSHAHI